MRNEILQLKDLGRMPNESINDTESIDELVNTYDALLEQIQLPISFDEAMVLVQIFPENAFYDLQWSLLNHCLIIIQTIQRIGDFCFIGVRYVQINCRCFYIGMSHKFLYGS